MSLPLLELSDIHAAYLQKEILRGVSLTVQVGEIVALLGENGSGKSSTLKVVAGLLRPSQGTIRYRGRNLDGLEIFERHRLGIGYLIQGGRVFPNLTVQENFDLAINAARPHSSGLVRLGNWFPALYDRRFDRAGLLSGGQRQMLAIETVLSQQPELLLLDEPTGALSEDLSHILLKQVRHYVEAYSAAILLVEHNIDVSNVATHCLRLVHGTIAASNED